MTKPRVDCCKRRLIYRSTIGPVYIKYKKNAETTFGARSPTL